jgi:CheY-like chemotaxis protein
VRVEHGGILWPDEHCLFQFPLNDQVFAFSGRVVWSRAFDRPGAVDALGFQSGLAFEGIPAAARPLLGQLLGRYRYRVLIVEDEAPVREVVASALGKAGYEIHEAANGLEGLEKAEQIMPDMILLDVRLPDMDGYEVCRRLKEDPATGRVPVIFLTAVEDPTLHHRATTAGGTACLLKPFRLEALLALTNTVIANARR